MGHSNDAHEPQNSTKQGHEEAPTSPPVPLGWKHGVKTRLHKNVVRPPYAAAPFLHNFDTHKSTIRIIVYALAYLNVFEWLPRQPGPDSSFGYLRTSYDMSRGTSATQDWAQSTAGIKTTVHSNYHRHQMAQHLTTQAARGQAL